MSFTAILVTVLMVLIAIPIAQLILIGSFAILWSIARAFGRLVEIILNK